MFKNFFTILLIAACFAISAVHPAQADLESRGSEDGSEICDEQSDTSEPSESAAEENEEDNFGCMLLSLAGGGFPELGAVDSDAGRALVDGAGGGTPGDGSPGDGGTKIENPGDGNPGSESPGDGGTKIENSVNGNPSNPEGSAPEGLVSEDSATVIPTPALLPGLIGFGIGAYRKHKARITST